MKTEPRTTRRRLDSSQRSQNFADAFRAIAGRFSPYWLACIPISAAIVIFWNAAAMAQDGSEVTVEQLQVALDTLWVLVAGMLVFFMNAGFGMLETGFCRQKNAVNILTKNLIVFALSTIAFWVIGFGLMFGNGNDFMGIDGMLFLSSMGKEGAYDSLSWANVPLLAKFFFQLAFAGTAATIVSGAVAERIKFFDFLIFSLLLVGIAYPLTGHWIWGGGWLANYGFWDFAGSTVVHSVGGWAALMGAAFLGARTGRYNSDGSGNALPGHNMSIATLGCLILWLGWFGFNPGSTMAVGDGSAIAHIAVTTNTAAAFGGVAATVVAWLVLGKPDLSMVINGILAGLVGITAGCAWVNIPSAAIIGAIAGAIVVFSVGFFDKLQIDDPVGATSVHLVCGIWGTLAVGLFAVGPTGVLYGEGGGPTAGLFMGGGPMQLWQQFVGVMAVGGMTVLLSTIFWLALKSTLGIRVTPEEEFEGLDISEHGMEAYHGFVTESDTFTGRSPAGMASPKDMTSRSEI